jgi:uncharacterized membrane protein
MDPVLSEWLNLLLRWTHIFAGILWIGSTWFFTWLDGRLHEEEAAGKEDKPQVWMVHSGGFYVVEKESQPDLGRALHWFRYEAAVTWLSGILLLALVYYHGGLMVDTDVADISEGLALAIGVGALIFSWPVYDGLMNSPLGRNDRLAALAGFLLITASAYGLTQWLSARAAYMHVGAILGGLMTANVWMRILPAQRKMIAATSAGKEPDARLAARAKSRSRHNTFMVVPVVLIMISHHYPTITYGHRYNWVILSVLVLVGFVVAKVIRRA